MASEEAAVDRNKSERKEREVKPNRESSSYFSFITARPLQRRTSSELNPPSSTGMTVVGTPSEKRKSKEKETIITDSSLSKSNLVDIPTLPSMRNGRQERLPLPVTSSNTKRARIDSTKEPGGLKVRWARFIVSSWRITLTIY